MKHFAGVVDGCVDFGPGLNVLFGPNELGKSTTAEAARAALLLQHTSKVHQSWIPWNSDETPSVELTIRTKEQRYLKIAKTFGLAARGKAMLSESKDGVSFSSVATSRNVDGEIRRLLNWGIPEPGAGSPKGLPETYLTSVLLPLQDDVTGVLDRSLSKDYDETGKQLLTDVIQSMGTDPLFKKVLSESQQQSERAFNTSGGRRRGKLSPWTKISEEIKTLKERVRTSREDFDRTEEVERNIRELFESKSKTDAALELAESALRAHHDFLRQRAEIDDQLQQATITRDNADETRARYQDVLSVLEQQQAAVDDAKQAMETAQQSLKQAQQNLESAKQNLAKASSDESAAQKRLELSDLDRELGQQRERQRDITELIARAEAAENIERKLTAQAQVVKDAQKAVRDQRAKLATTEADLSALVGFDLWQQKQNALKSMGDIEKQRSQLATLRMEQAELERQIDEATAQVTALNSVPEHPQIEKMRQLETALQVENASLEAGVKVQLKALQDLQIAASADGKDDSKSLKEKANATFETGARLELTIAGVADIVIERIGAQSRDQFNKLQQQWDRDVAPMLAAMQKESVEDIAAARRELDRILRLVEELAGRLSENEAAVQNLQDVDERAVALQESIDQLTIELTKFDAKSIAEVGRQLTDTLFGEMNTTITTRRQSLANEKTRLQTENAVCEEKLSTAKKTLLELNEALKTAAENLSGPWQDVLKSSRQELIAVKESQTALEQRRKTLSEEAGTDIGELEAARDTAEESVKELQPQFDQLQQVYEKALRLLDTTKAEVKPRKEALDKVDPDAARALVKELEDQRSQLLVPESSQGPDGSERTTADLQQAVDNKKSEMNDLRDQINQQEGVLKLIGGDSARDRYERDQEALRLKEDHEIQLERDLNAWKLLRETLIEAEEQDVKHLGQTLTEPVTRRFGELTQGRYGDMQLGPALESHGIEADGDSRDIDRLSVGTQEQLCTVLRLCIAEQLGSVLMLDDQLTQSDPERMAWFRKMFRESASTTQIIVMTCRPEDYLQQDEFNNSELIVDSADGLVRAINMKLALE